MLPDSANDHALTEGQTLPASERLTHSSIRTAYRRLAPVYDFAFNGVFRQGRRLTIQALAPQPGERVLEVGVGTGLMLRYWPAHAQITGVDLSPEMLARAQRACERHRLEHVNLRLMDAQAMDFADNSFDKVAAMYVVSVTPDAGALLREMQRVCAPGGRICIVNHFEHKNGLLRRIEQRLSNHAGMLGWDSALPIEQVTQRPGLRIRQVRRVNFAGYWSLIEAENVK